MYEGKCEAAGGEDVEDDEDEVASASDGNDWNDDQWWNVMKAGVTHLVYHDHDRRRHPR